MRIWSIHPKYLDAKGLVALWRETLLAKNVLEGRTKGYKNHPQLNRFKLSKNPLNCINQYLSVVYKVAKERGYNFNRDKIDWDFQSEQLASTSGQLEFEMKHLLRKLKVRDIQKYNELIEIPKIDPHPLFKIQHGDIEDWEKI